MNTPKKTSRLIVRDTRNLTLFEFHLWHAGVRYSRGEKQRKNCFTSVLWGRCVTPSSCLIDSKYGSLILIFRKRPRRFDRLILPLIPKVLVMQKVFFHITRAITLPYLSTFPSISFIYNFTKFSRHMLPKHIDDTL